jgi:hypothetical protein
MEMASQWWTDDDQLMAELGDALRHGRAAPSEFVAAGKAAYMSRNIDAELADLT